MIFIGNTTQEWTPLSPSHIICVGFPCQGHLTPDEKVTMRFRFWQQVLFWSMRWNILCWPKTKTDLFDHARKYILVLPLNFRFTFGNSFSEKFVDIVPTPAIHEGNTRLCFVALLAHTNHSWLHLYCLGQHGQFILEQAIHERLNVLKIASTKESSPSYFSVIESAKERSQIRIYSVRSAGLWLLRV